MLDNTMCCAKCGKRMSSVVIADSGRTDFCCAYCDDAHERAEIAIVPVVDPTALSLVPGYKIDE